MDSEPKILYFRRPAPKPYAFMVYVQKHHSNASREDWCTPFETLDDAIDYIEKEEEDIGTHCQLFQYIPEA